MINYTVIIPHYNIPELLRRCLKSIPCRDDVQVIVVDDCSTDENHIILKEMDNDFGNVQFVYLEKNQGGEMPGMLVCNMPLELMCSLLTRMIFFMNALMMFLTNIKMRLVMLSILVPTLLIQKHIRLEIGQIFCKNR